mgnify:CR=1 FL=1
MVGTWVPGDTIEASSMYYPRRQLCRVHVRPSSRAREGRRVTRARAGGQTLTRTSMLSYRSTDDSAQVRAIH